MAKRYTLDELCRECRKPLETLPSAKRIALEVWEIDGRFYTRITGKGKPRLTRREICLCQFEPLTSQEAYWLEHKTDSKLETAIE
jgi:hypothetical protein